VRGQFKLRYFKRFPFNFVYNLQFLLKGTKVKLELDRAKDSFVLMKEESDTDNYKLKLLYIALYMPIASISQEVSREINSIITKDNPVKIQYRNIEIRPLTITKQTTSFYSELLFSDTVPARLVIFFVPTDAKGGSFVKNPFNLRRKWKYTVPVPPKPQSEEDDSNLSFAEQRIKQVEETNKKLLESLQTIQEQLASFTSKGKGRGKSSKRPSTTGSITNNLQNVTLNDLGAAATSPSDISIDDLQSLPSTSSASTRSRRQTDITVESAAATKEFYITSIDLTINGISVDQERCYKTNNNLYVMLLQLVKCYKTNTYRLLLSLITSTD